MPTATVVRMCVEFRTADLARRFFGTANDSSLRPMAGRPANTVDSMRCDAGKAATTNLSWNGRLYSKLSAYTFLHPFVFDALLSVFALVSCQAA